MKLLLSKLYWRKQHRYASYTQNGIGLNDLYTSPVVVTIHDLIPYILPETVGRGYLQRFLRDMPLIVSNSKIILTVSEYSKRDIMKFFPFVDEEKNIRYASGC